MKRLLQITLAVICGWTLANGSASAQEATPSLPPPRLVKDHATTHVEPAAYSITPLAPRRDVQSCDLSCQTRSPLQESCLRHTQQFENAVIGVMNSKGCGCMSSHNSHGCIDTHAHYMFFFGSCREFFSEPCFPPPQTDRPFGRLLTLCGK